MKKGKKSKKRENMLLAVIVVILVVIAIYMLSTIKPEENTVSNGEDVANLETEQVSNDDKEKEPDLEVNSNIKILYK